MGYPARSVPFLQHALVMEPKNVTAQFNMAVANLLQGDYKPKRQVNRNLQLWRSSSMLVAACLLMYLVQLGLTNWQLSRQSAALQQQSRDLYLQAFPNERIVNLNLQLQQKLASTGAEGEQSFIHLLFSLQQQLAQVPDISLDNLRYDSKRAELRFQAKGDGFQSFERLKTALEQAGFSVEQGALSNDGAKVQGSVAMRGKV
jgi:general secretion pathway protein L